MIEWHPYRKQGRLPVERRSVLVMIDKREHGTAATVAVGYLRVHSDGPFFVVPGVPHQDTDITTIACPVKRIT